MYQTFKTISLRRKIVASLLALSVISTAILSLAALNDVFTIDSRFETANVSITGNGEEALSILWEPGISGTAYNEYYGVEVTNEGTVELAYSIASSVTYSPASPNGWSNVTFSVHTAADVASCEAGIHNGSMGTGDRLGTFALGTPGAGVRTLAVGASETLCLKVSAASPTFGETDAADQTLTFYANATGL